MSRLRILSSHKRDCVSFERLNLKNKANLADRCDGVDRRTNALQTNRPTDRPTDTASFRGALSHLKSFDIGVCSTNQIGFCTSLPFRRLTEISWRYWKTCRVVVRPSICFANFCHDFKLAITRYPPLRKVRVVHRWFVTMSDHFPRILTWFVNIGFWVLTFLIIAVYDKSVTITAIWTTGKTKTGRTFNGVATTYLKQKEPTTKIGGSMVLSYPLKQKCHFLSDVWWIILYMMCATILPM